MSNAPHLTRRKRNRRRRIVLFFRENMVEIAAAALLLTAVIIYLVYSPDLTEAPQFVDVFMQAVNQSVENTRSWSARFFTEAVLLKIITGVLVLAGVMLILWRARYRYLRSEAWNSHTCPRCSGVVHRIHRKPADRLLDPLILPYARRFRCPECSWEGMRSGRKSGSSS